MKTKKIFFYITLLLAALTLELLLLTAVSSLPKALIRENVLVSAEYLCEKAPFFHLSSKDSASRIDRYADAILLNLAWSVDTNSPLLSAVSSAYYHDEYANENTNLLYAVTNDTTPTYEYMRYWHGSLVLVRPLLILFSIKEIYILCAITLLALMSIAAYSIYRNYGKAVLCCFLISACVCSIWYVPFSLEYMPTFLISFTSVPVTIALLKKFPEKLGCLFFILGNLTAYTDFLTTETLTCLLPMILILLPEHKINTKPINLCLKSGGIWLLGYCGTWISKWLLYSALTGKNGLADALTQTAYRTGGEVVQGGLITQIFGALVRNLRCLFPFSLVKDSAGMVTVVIFLIITGMIFYLVKKQKNMPSVVFVLWLIGCIPYIRYVILSNHSFIHYFFTHRAQFSSVFCLLLIFHLGTDTEFLKKEWKKMHKRK